MDIKLILVRVHWQENIFKMNLQLINGASLKLGFFTHKVRRICIIFLKNFMRLFITTYLPLFINVLERSYKDESVYENNVATVSINEINNLIFQNNYLGLNVKVIGEHISSLDKKLDDLTTLIVQIKSDLKSSEQTFTSKQLDVHIQRPLEIQEFFLNPYMILKNFLRKSFQNLVLNLLIYLKILQMRWKPLLILKIKPTPQDVLIEKCDCNQTYTFYNGSEIYEWNLDYLTVRQLTILVHRMLMYATICKSVNNTDRTICKMIIAGFTGQLRGWWDTYISLEEKAVVLNAKAVNKGVDNLGFALIYQQYETVRSLLNGLRCRHLGKFRWYKDTYLSWVMELLENSLEHWKANFIDGLPPLFVERVKKTLRNSQGANPFGAYTYGKFIGAYTQEGINLCNELNLSRKLKIDKLRERTQLGYFCTQFGLPDTTAKGTKHRDSNKFDPDKSHRKRISR
ncbi:hypothetical protein H5410_001982 [Solanum commersonii]|uniref:DUF7746 domain-containing protein n=1 Tax=Solanum commersonii TaxID=4109 RepID=A0A9J6B0Q1_SOLCO|nr:hypothetical protein H5410_001982 [Solanum commersonii]